MIIFNKRKNIYDNVLKNIHMNVRPSHLMDYTGFYKRKQYLFLRIYLNRLWIDQGIACDDPANILY